MLMESAKELLPTDCLYCGTTVSNRAVIFR